MKKLCSLLVLAIVASLVCFAVESVDARPPYKTEFDKKYVKKDSTDEKEKTIHKRGTTTTRPDTKHKDVTFRMGRDAKP